MKLLEAKWKRPLREDKLQEPNLRWFGHVKMRASDPPLEM